MVFNQGVALIEIICPIRCNGILFGLSTLGQNPQTVTQTFHSSTKRTVSIVADFNKNIVSYFINGRYHKKLKTKKIEKTGLDWHGYIEFKEPGNYVVLNPFCRMPWSESKSP